MEAAQFRNLYIPANLAKQAGNLAAQSAGRNFFISGVTQDVT